jgi:hypothetical protein
LTAAHSAVVLLATTTLAVVRLLHVAGVVALLLALATAHVDGLLRTNELVVATGRVLLVLLRAGPVAV